MARRATPSDLRAFIRDIPDFPRPGIVFKDITPLLLDPRALDAAVTGWRASPSRSASTSWSPPRRAGSSSAARSRAQLGAGFVPARKPGKLPHETVSAEYALEYGIDALEVHADALAGGARVLVHDDLLATGGTAGALCELVAELGGEIVACAFLVELELPRRSGAARAARRARADRLRRAEARWRPPAAAARSPPRRRRCGRCSRTPTTCRAGGRGWADGGRRGGPLHAGVHRPRRAGRCGWTSALLGLRAAVAARAGSRRSPARRSSGC